MLTASRKGAYASMRLKPDVNLTDFLIAVGKCTGEVTFTTPEGDLLNLKSILSRYVFVAAVFHPELLADGSVICRNPADIEFLHDFVVSS